MCGMTRRVRRAPSAALRCGLAATGASRRERTGRAAGPGALLVAPLLIGLVVAAGGFAQAPASRDRSRPNILFILADDHRFDAVAAFGNAVVRTPNIDSLARRGFRFSRAYCMGSMGGAVCVPSRAMLNSGRTLFRVKMDLSDARILPEVLRGAGYATFGTGKWHNRPPSFLRGFERGRAVFFGGMSDHTKVPVVDTTSEGRQRNKRLGESFSSTLFVDAAIDFLKRHDGRRPFYAYVAFTAPHDPRQAPPGYVDRYDPASIPLPPSFMPQHPFQNGWLTVRDETLAPWPRTERVIRHQIAEYYGLIAHMDAEIGRLLATLEETGLNENTIIVYAADHGLALGSHGLLGKQSLYEHSMRAPLVFAGPGIPEGKSSDALVYLFDVFPSVCALTGVRAPDGLDGKSLTPIWGGETTAVRRTLFTVFSRTMRAVRGTRWKLIRYPKINRSQLFDLENDPHELTSLAGEPRHRKKLDEMMALLKRCQRDAGDDLPLTSEKPMPAEVDLTGRPRTPDRHQPEWIVRKYFRMEGWGKKGAKGPRD